MNRGLIFKVLVLLFLISIALTVAIGVAENYYPPKLVGTSVSVLPADVVWSKVYGVVGDDDRLYCELPTSQGYLVVGSSESNTSGVTVGWALMLDHNGNAVWNKTFLQGSGTELRCALNLTSGFLLVGNEFLSSGDINGYVAKIDSQGNLVWNKTLGGNGTNELYSAFAAPNGFVLMGLSSQNGGAQSKAWIVKIGTDGNLVWSKTYDFAAETVATTGVLAPDGDYMVGGYADTRGINGYDFLLLKIDPNGNLIWNQTYGATGSQEATAMTESSDGYVMVGNTQSPGGNMHAWVVKVDLNGTLLWARTVGGRDADSPSYVAPSEYGGYLVAGFTFSFGAGNRDFWLFKITDSGQVLWSCTQGNAGFQEAYGVIQTGKNQYIMAGWTDPPGETNLIGKAKYMFYIVEIKYPVLNSVSLVLQFAFFATLTTCVLLAALIVVLRLHHKWNANKSPECMIR